MAPKRKQKALKVKHAIGKALPARLAGIAPNSGVASKNLQPVPGEPPLVILRVQVIGCTDLVGKDRNGFSDPYVTVGVLNQRHSTPAVKKSNSPIYDPAEATFDLPLHLSLAERVGALEIVVWDKDMIGKEYLGEVALSVDEWFPQRGPKLDWNSAEERSLALISTRSKATISGSVRIKMGFVRPTPTDTHASTKMVDPSLPLEDIYTEFLQRQQWNLTSVPPTSTIGTIPSVSGGPEFEDDGFSSDEDDEPTSTDPSGNESATDSDDQGYETAEDFPAHIQGGHVPHALRGHRTQIITGSDDNEPTPTATVPSLFADPEPLVQSPSMVDPNKTPQPPSKVPSQAQLQSPRPRLQEEGRKSSRFLKKLIRKGSSISVASESGAETPTATKLGKVSESKPKKDKRRRRKRESGFELDADNDIVGIVMLEINAATDLPRLRNFTRIGWDMDPFVVVSFGKKVFRTRVIRHSRDPEWNEKLLFHVRRYETKFNVKFSVLDWDKISTHDKVGEAIFNVGDLIREEQKDERGIYQGDTLDGDEKEEDMKDFVLPLTPGEGTSGERPWEAKHKPQLKFRAKYQPYSILRRRFWHEYLKQYDADDTRTISRVELTSMLDSLGSTLSAKTVDAFWTRYGKDSRAEDAENELTFEECVACLEESLLKPATERKRLDDVDYRLADGDTATGSHAANTPSGAEQAFEDLEESMAHMNFAGPPGNIPSDGEHLKPSQPVPHPTVPNSQPIAEVTPRAKDVFNPVESEPGPITRASSHQSGSSRSSGSSPDTSDSDASPEPVVERVINIRNCPLCHRPRMGRKAEVDIVTHMALCASQDWGRVDRIMVGNFVTSSQAQRKWYTKLLGKVGAGSYQLGANSANIIVQNRTTGQLEEEKMQVYVRLGIRLLYKGAKSRMEGARARRLLKSMSIKQGVKYDSPESAKDILPFIEFHRLNVNEILDPLDSFQTFNQFFYRKLKPDARPIESPDDPSRLVSGADCRMMAFETVQEATRIWIKGREFTVARLLGLDQTEEGRQEARRFEDGALAIFRLAPQDYHRFHSPVDGTIGPMRYIAGEYYTVNPQAIRTALDVYGENARKIVQIDSPHFGRVMAVCVGAMMVGSIITTVDEGQTVRRGQEFGCFAFGGSTIVLLFEKGVVEWDEDLLINGRASLETLVRVGMGVGRSRRTATSATEGAQPRGLSFNPAS